MLRRINHCNWACEEDSKFVAEGASILLWLFRNIVNIMLAESCKWLDMHLHLHLSWFFSPKSQKAVHGNFRGNLKVSVLLLFNISNCNAVYTKYISQSQNKSSPRRATRSKQWSRFSRPRKARDPFIPPWYALNVFISLWNNRLYMAPVWLSCF